MIVPLYISTFTRDKAMSILAKCIKETFCHRKLVVQRPETHAHRPNLRKGHDRKFCEACKAGKCPRGYFQKDRSKLEKCQEDVEEEQWVLEADGAEMVCIQWEWRNVLLPRL